MSLKRIFLMALAALFAAATTGPVSASRVALVIGNSDYKHETPLRNTLNDARAIAGKLRSLGFDRVDHVENQTLNDLSDSLRRFTNAAAGADVALIYFAGHGLEMGGKNYLIPTDAKLTYDYQVASESVELTRILDAARPAKTLRLVILDACRNNPFASKIIRSASNPRSIGRGLARIEPEADTLVAFAAKAGTVAADGFGNHSPYTKALLKHMSAPGVAVDRMFGRVRDDVRDATNKKQIPFLYGSLGRTIVSLSGRSSTDGGGTSSLPPTPTQPPAPPVASISDDFKLAQSVNTLGGWNAFIRKYGHDSGNFYVALAIDARRKLTAPPPPPPTQPATTATGRQSPDCLVQLGYFGSAANARSKHRRLRRRLPGLRIATPRQFPGLPQLNGRFLVLGPMTRSKAIETLDRAKRLVPDAFSRHGFRPGLAAADPCKEVE